MYKALVFSDLTTQRTWGQIVPSMVVKDLQVLTVLCPVHLVVVYSLSHVRLFVTTPQPCQHQPHCITHCSSNAGFLLSCLPPHLCSEILLESLSQFSFSLTAISPPVRSYLCLKPDPWTLSRVIYSSSKGLQNLPSIEFLFRIVLLITF